VELLVPEGLKIDEETLTRDLPPILGSASIPCALTVALLSQTGDYTFKTFARVSGGFVLRRDLSDIHPEAAKRIHLERYSAFELERISSDEGIYAFHGRSRDVPGDERVFVLADARDRRPLAGPELSHHLPAFERVFHRCTRTLRSILKLSDPGRRLQWNRIAIYVASEIVLDEKTAGGIAHRLAAATRHLGLEKVLVTLNLKNPDAPDEPARATEVVISETGAHIEISWREPSLDPLRPVKDYERKVVAARRRRLAYPYEIIKMLSSGERALADGEGADESLPSGTFEEFELDPEAELPVAVSVEGRPHGQNVAGIVFGIISTPTDKVPEGMRRVLILSDPTMGMGALARPECDRIIAAMDLAERLGLPVEWVPVSGGAKIAMDSGTENLDATACVVRRIVNFTQAGGVIHLIVQGVNVGAQSYFNALATMLMHTRGVLIMTPRASMVLTGRAALEASGAVAAEDEVAIGGFERIMGPNGEAQYYARNLAQAYRILYDYYRYSYVVPGEKGPRRFETQDPSGRSVCDFLLPDVQPGGFQTVGEIFDDTTNPGRKRPFAMREVMSALVDQDGGRLERWYSMVAGETAIVWDAHLGGLPITLIGIESQSVPREGYRPHDGPESWTGGTLFPYSSKKVARAINAANGNRPVLVLANLSGFDGSPESLRNLQLEYGAEIARAVVNFEGPILFLVVSRYHGGAYVVFSQELNDSLSASALTGSYASVIGGGPAATVVFAREVRAQATADPRVAEIQRTGYRQSRAQAREAFDAVFKEVVLEKQAELAAEFDRIHSVERAREVGSLSRIVAPARMRPELISELTTAVKACPS
jgi:acetyl-CoA carboxylase carboxyltransferase component